MQHRKLLLLALLVSFFALGIIVWYFFFSTPVAAPTLNTTSLPLSGRGLPARFAFIFGEDAPDQTTETEVTIAGPVPFRAIWKQPTAGNMFVTKQILKEVVATSTSTSSPQVTKTIRATTTVLMFVDRSTGYIYGHSVESGATYQISNTTLPGIYDAYIWGDGDRILMRYLDSDRKTILSVLATIPNVQEGRDPQALTSLTYLPNNIRSVAVSRSRSLISYLLPNDLGSSVYTITSKGTGKIADSPFSEWKLSYGGEKLYATTRPSAYIEGMTVSLPSFSRIIGGKTGLMSLPSFSGDLLNSMWSRSGLALFGQAGGSTSVLDIKTLVEKCSAVSATQFICGVPKSLPESSEGMPDDWYQGRVLFDDTLMLVYPFKGESYGLYSFPEKDGPMDVTHLEMNPGADLVSFIRKNDGSLWLLNTNLLSDE